MTSRSKPALRLAQLADLHLGFRQFERNAPGGMNQREADVQDALARAIDDLLAARPDLVCIAGDVFHAVRPPNAAIVFLSHQLERIRIALPRTRIIVVAGNHDTARTAEAGTILPLYRRLGVDVVTAGVERIALPGCTVTCVPSSAAQQLAGVEPDSAAPLNVLLIHAAAPLVSHGEADVTDEQLQRWDYVAMGDYHVAGQVGPRAWYSGSLEFTSTNSWSECHQPKGYLLVELAAGAEPVVEFRPIAARQFLDLAPVDAQGFGPAELDAALASALGAVELTGAVARLVVLNVPRDLQRTIDYKALRVFKAQAFHLQVDFRRPDVQSHKFYSNARLARTLNGTAEAYLRARPLPADLEAHREDLVKLGAKYLAAASDLPDPYTGEKVA